MAGWDWQPDDDDPWIEEDMSRLTKARERRAVRRPKPPPRRESRPTGGGVFFRAGQPPKPTEPETIRDIFRRVLDGTALGRRLGW